jgi:hypothetical protein
MCVAQATAARDQRNNSHAAGEVSALAAMIYVSVPRLVAQVTKALQGLLRCISPCAVP